MSAHVLLPVFAIARLMLTTLIPLFYTVSQIWSCPNPYDHLPLNPVKLSDTSIFEFRSKAFSQFNVATNYLLSVQGLSNVLKEYYYPEDIFERVLEGKAVFLQSRSYTEFHLTTRYTTLGVPRMRFMKVTLLLDNKHKINLYIPMLIHFHLSEFDNLY